MHIEGDKGTRHSTHYLLHYSAGIQQQQQQEIQIQQIQLQQFTQQPRAITELKPTKKTKHKKTPKRNTNKILRKKVQFTHNNSNNNKPHKMNTQS